MCVGCLLGDEMRWQEEEACKRGGARVLPLMCMENNIISDSTSIPSCRHLPSVVPCPEFFPQPSWCCQLPLEQLGWQSLASGGYCQLPCPRGQLAPPCAICGRLKEKEPPTSVGFNNKFLNFRGN